MATTELKVFHGVGAVIARVTSHTKFSAFAIISPNETVDFSQTARLFEVDLRATPGNVGTTEWSKVKFDDRGVTRDDQELPPQLDVISLPLGITTLGSGGLEDLERGRFVGAVYIEHDHYNAIYGDAIAIPSNPTPWPGDYYKRFQVTSVAYSASGTDPRAGKRYHGFRGIVRGVVGRLIQVEFPQRDGSVLGPWWFNLDAADECDSDPPPAALDGEPSIAAGPVAGQEGAFFIALPHAAGLSLSGPKLPIGLEELRFTATVAEILVTAPKRKQVSVSVVSNDPVLKEVLAKIDGEARVTTVLGPHGVEGVVKEAVGSVRPTSMMCTLDLIAHAKNGILQFGGWVVDAHEQDSAKLSGLWGARKPDMIRLLGCNTAATKPGRAAMKHLASVFGRRVYGATGPLYARDFDKNGLTKKSEILLAADNDKFGLVEDRLSDATVERWFQRFGRIAGAEFVDLLGRLRAETREEATRERAAEMPGSWPVGYFTADDLERLLAELVHEIAEAPGLLAVPDFDALFPVRSSDGEARFHRVTILLGGRFVRVYPIDYPDGVILRAKRVLPLHGGSPVPLPA
jgi:hypothetical protein